MMTHVIATVDHTTQPTIAVSCQLLQLQYVAAVSLAAVDTVWTLLQV
jgi:hypothetical protein